MVKEPPRVVCALGQEWLWIGISPLLPPCEVRIVALIGVVMDGISPLLTFGPYSLPHTSGQTIISIGEGNPTPYGTSSID